MYLIVAVVENKNKKIEFSFIINIVLVLVPTAWPQFVSADSTIQTFYCVLYSLQHAPAKSPFSCSASCTCFFFPVIPQRTPRSHPNMHTVLIQPSHFLLAPWKANAWKRTGAYVRIDICRVGGRVAERIVLFGCCPKSSDSMVQKEGFFFSVQFINPIRQCSLFRNAN